MNTLVSSRRLAAGVFLSALLAACGGGSGGATNGSGGSNVGNDSGGATSSSGATASSGGIASGSTTSGNSTVEGGSATGVAGDAVTKLALVHNALTYDRTRNRYYASLPGSVAVNGNRIATIDAATGTVSYSAAVGSEPSALGLSADGSALYVGLDGSGEVVKLHLPDLAEQWRVRLSGTSLLRAERIAVSPQDADAVAVSTYYAAFSPRHFRVLLVRAGTMQPTVAQDGGSNLVAFGGDGRFVYGFNNETTEFGLRRFAVLSSGLRQEQTVTGASKFGIRTLDWTADRLVLDKAVLRTPDLALLGTVNVEGGGCRPHAASGRLVCADSAPYGSSAAEDTLAVVDANSFVVVARPVYQRGASRTLAEIVPGPVGQVALRMNAGLGIYYNTPSDEVWLFVSPTLQ